jgi:hypothetical protein
MVAHLDDAVLGLELASFHPLPRLRLDVQEIALAEGFLA